MHRSSPPILILRNLGKKESHPHLLNAINPSRSLRIRSFPRRIDRFIRFSLVHVFDETRRAGTLLREYILQRGAYAESFVTLPVIYTITRSTVC